MLCAISGVSPEEPVASRKSGQIFEKRLIEQYIEQNGTEPNTGEELSSDELLSLQNPRNTKPRPPTLTSIPSLLSVFQNEWDTLALESHALRQQLLSTRQELSSALYQHDAAVRVIARVTAERDQAREALAQLSIGAGRSGDEMQVDGGGIPQALTTIVSETRERLSKTRRKRAPPPNWADEEVIQSFVTTQTLEPVLANVVSFAVNNDHSLALIVGSGEGAVYSLADQTKTKSLPTDDGRIEQAIWIGDRIALATDTGIIKLLEADGSEVFSSQAHTGHIQAIRPHPSGDILVSIGSDHTFAVYDLRQGKLATRQRVEADLRDGAIHPDGVLLAIGDAKGHIRVFDLTDCEEQAVFDSTGVVSRLEFSENGVWLASTSVGESTVSIWDLRKMTLLHSLQLGGEIHDLSWDYTGQHLATVGSEGTTVQHYNKAKKAWSEPLRAGILGGHIAWGSQARSLLVVSDSSEILTLGEPSST